MRRTALAGRLTLRPRRHIPDRRHHQADVSALRSPAEHASIVATRDVNSSLLSALVSAQPYQGLTMLFMGAVRTQTVSILLDTGSSHNYVKPGLSADASAEGSPYSITLADNSTIDNVYGKQLSFSCQHVTCQVHACEMPLPKGVDIILGQHWLQTHAAVLDMSAGQCNFMNDEHAPAVWQTSIHLKSSPYNSSLLMTSAARICRSAKQQFVALVRCCMPSTDSSAMANAESQQVAGVRSHAAAAPGDSGMLLDYLFVEQHSAVDGIKQLVQQFAEVFPVSVPAGLPVDRGIAHAIYCRIHVCLLLRHIG